MNRIPSGLLRRAVQRLRNRSAPVIQTLWQGDSQFGECPVWYEASAALFWLDIPSGVLRAYNTSSGTVKSWPLSRPTAGLVLMPGTDVLLAGQGLELLSFNIGTAQCTPFDTVPGGDANERVNDLAYDRAGSLWVATMDVAGKRPVGRLMRRTPKGAWHTKLQGIAIVNGPAFGAAVRGANPTAYHSTQEVGYVCDTNARKILRFQPSVTEDADTLACTDFVCFDVRDGFPDGVHVNADGAVWVAHFAGGCVTCWAPDAQLIARVDVPARNPTSVALGGNTLFITSGAKSNTNANNDLGGALFSLAIPQHLP